MSLIRKGNGWKSRNAPPARYEYAGISSKTNKKIKAELTSTVDVPGMKEIKWCRCAKPTVHLWCRAPRNAGACVLTRVHIKGISTHLKRINVYNLINKYFLSTFPFPDLYFLYFLYIFVHLIFSLHVFKTKYLFIYW